MAVDLVVTYPGRVDAADAEYPFGKPRNRVSPGDGTPFDEALYRDYVGMMAAAMRQSGITAATNVPEKVGASQMLQGIARHIAGGSTYMIDSGVADAYVIDVPGVAPNIFESPSVLFDGMKVRWLAANANTGPATLDVEFQGSSISSPQSLTREGGAALTGGEINTVVENEARFDLGNSRWELTKAANIGTATPAGLVLIQKQSIVTQASVDFTTGIDSTYDNYLIKGSKVAMATDNTNLWALISTDGGSTFKSGGSDYRYAIQAKPDNGAAANTGATAAQMLLTQNTLGLGNLATELQNFDLNFYGPSEASPTSIFFTGALTGDSAEMIENTMAGRYVTATAVNGIQVLPSSGNISGEFALYGFNITP